ncbi:MAG TPA: ParA family protein [Anaerolineales bacterium]|nr:ParA family protein [Anaerolineales bacterium]
MGRVIAVANQKGGVGKTSTVANLGAALARRGKRVFLLDLDPQGGLTASFGLDPYSLQATTLRFFEGEGTPLRKVVYPVGAGLWLAPASVELARVEHAAVHTGDRIYTVRTMIDEERGPVDFLIIDTPPSLGMLTVNALVAADELLVPVSCQYMALRGIRSILEALWLIHDRYAPGLRLLGILPTQFNPRSEHSRAVVAELRRVFATRVLDSVIDFDDAVATGPAVRKPAFDVQPSGSGAAAYLRLADEVINRKP